MAPTHATVLLAAHAPITYVSSQLGHANPTTTLRYYARWIPTKGQWWVDVLDGTGAASPAAFTERAPRAFEVGPQGRTIATSQ